ncbi:MAG: oxidoreductase [Planctomycetes bacterium]|nr:oxidoreductase [Planctomycetota bacterium]
MPDPVPSSSQDRTAPDAAPVPATRRRIKDLEVMVADVIPETADTTTLVLFTGNDALDHRPGHFLTIDPHQFAALDRWTRWLEDSKGRCEPPRAYSLASAPHEHRLAITVKEERYTSGVDAYPPLLSPLLVRRTPRGTRMVITGFTGPYVLPDDIEQRTDHLLHVCAGSGVVPNASILKHCFEHHPKLRHTLVLGNKTWDDVIFRDALAAMQRERPANLRVVHALSREPAGARRGAEVVSGRVDVTLLASLLDDPTAVEVFTCGPAVSRFEKQRAKLEGVTPAPRFQETVLDALEVLGVPKQRVHKESFG